MVGKGGGNPIPLGLGETYPLAARPASWSAKAGSPVTIGSACACAWAMAVSSGASALEAAAVVSDGSGPDPADRAAVRDIGADAVIIHAGPDGKIRQVVRP